DGTVKATIRCVGAGGLLGLGLEYETTRESELGLRPVERQVGRGEHGEGRKVMALYMPRRIDDVTPNGMRLHTCLKQVHVGKTALNLRPHRGCRLPRVHQKCLCKGIASVRKVLQMCRMRA